MKDLLTGLTGCPITLVTIIQNYHERTEWISDKTVSAGSILDKFRKAFTEEGVRDEGINLSIVMKEYTSIAKCILGERERFVCGTVVIRPQRHFKERGISFWGHLEYNPP